VNCGIGGLWELIADDLLLLFFIVATIWSGTCVEIKSYNHVGEQQEALFCLELPHDEENLIVE
jgi:hypothetical protein